MLILNQSVMRAVSVCWAALLVTAVGLNGWQLKPIESPASLVVLSLAFLLIAFVTLAVLTSARARHVLADPAADLATARIPLWILFFASGFVGAGSSVAAFLQVRQPRIPVTAGRGVVQTIAKRPAIPVVDNKIRTDDDIKRIDAYLAKWDRFARGENSLKPGLKRDAADFGAALGRALNAKDRRAPSRLVFWGVVQVAGCFILPDSDLGRNTAELLGPKFPVIEDENGRFYYAGDLYFWWLEHQQQYEPYALFDEWAKREFAQKTVIPSYTKQIEKRKGRVMTGGAIDAR